MTEVMIEVTVPDGEEPLTHRGKVENRASDLGWPQAQSGGTSMTEPLVALQWSIDQIDSIARVVAVLRQEFEVTDVSITDAPQEIATIDIENDYQATVSIEKNDEIVLTCSPEEQGPMWFANMTADQARALGEILSHAADHIAECPHAALRIGPGDRFSIVVDHGDRRQSCVEVEAWQRRRRNDRVHRINHAVHSSLTSGATMKYRLRGNRLKTKAGQRQLLLRFLFCASLYF